MGVSHWQGCDPAADAGPLGTDAGRRAAPAGTADRPQVKDPGARVLLGYDCGAMESDFLGRQHEQPYHLRRIKPDQGSPRSCPHRRQRRLLPPTVPQPRLATRSTGDSPADSEWILAFRIGSSPTWAQGTRPNARRTSLSLGRDLAG